MWYFNNVYFRIMTLLDDKLLEVLVCPISNKTLSYNKETNELLSEDAGLAYPIKDGIPIMLPDEARKIK